MPSLAVVVKQVCASSPRGVSSLTKAAYQQVAHSYSAAACGDHNDFFNACLPCEYRGIVFGHDAASLLPLNLPPS
jgi:hypothetical protein